MFFKVVKEVLFIGDNGLSTWPRERLGRLHKVVVHRAEVIATFSEKSVNIVRIVGSETWILQERNVVFC